MKFSVPCNAWKFAIPEHNNIKQDVLNEIEKMGCFSFNTGEQKISHTDWHLDRNFPRPYAEIICPILESYYPDNSLFLSQFWFQQYATGDFHGKHHHGGYTAFSCVYYLELPDVTMKTKYFGVPEIEIAEGDFLIMPAFIEHESPINTSGRKTVIVQNINYQ